VPQPPFLGNGREEKELHVSVNTKTGNYSIVDDLAALSTKAAGSVAPDLRDREQATRVETWPASALPANGKGFGPGGKPLPCPERKENGASASNDPWIGGAYGSSRSSSLTGSGGLHPGYTNQLRRVGMPAHHQQALGTHGQACLSYPVVTKGIAQGVSAASPKRSNVGGPISDGKSSPASPSGQAGAYLSFAP